MGCHPAVLRLIDQTVRGAHGSTGSWVGVCGGIAGDPQAVPILIGLGIDELSVSVPAIPGDQGADPRAAAGRVPGAGATRRSSAATAAEVRALVPRRTETDS